MDDHADNVRTLRTSAPTDEEIDAQIAAAAARTPEQVEADRAPKATTAANTIQREANIYAIKAHTMSTILATVWLRGDKLPNARDMQCYDNIVATCITQYDRTYTSYETDNREAEVKSFDPSLGGDRSMQEVLAALNEIRAALAKPVVAVAAE